MDTYGLAFIAELYGCDADPLKHTYTIEQLMLKVAKEAHLNVVSQHFHQFEPGGVSGGLILSQSHMMIHTWWEVGYCALDVFVCEPCPLIPRAIEKFGKWVNAVKVDMFPYQRGLRSLVNDKHVEKLNKEAKSKSCR